MSKECGEFRGPSNHAWWQGREAPFYMGQCGVIPRSHRALAFVHMPW